ncbi:nociceptin receptor-like, partial [Asterias amurensis]|uniref:nociceptin receptor-like n=1 Tax=Asterias amurensis TaxID=7602 RepID=UPI003AB56EEE
TDQMYTMEPTEMPDQYYNYTSLSFYYYYYYDNPSGSYYWPYIINSISFKGIAPLGLLLNVIFLFVVFRVRAMHTTANIHLSNLAVADIMYLALMEFRFVTGDSSFATLVVNYVAYMASMFFVTVVALGRAFAINYPFRAREVLSKSLAVKAAVVVWIISLLASIGYNILRVNLSDDDQNALDIVHLCINPTFLVLNIVLYTCMISGLLRSLGQMAESSVNQRRMVQMLTINTTVFFSFHIAVTTFNLYSRFNNVDPTVMNIGHSAIFMLLTINSSVNPVVYSATNADYRTAVVTAFCCGRCFWRRRRGSTTQTTNSYTIIRMNNLRVGTNAV